MKKVGLDRYICIYNRPSSLKELLSELIKVENLEGVAHSDSRHREDVTGQLEEIIVTIFHALAGKYLYLFARDISCPGWHISLFLCRKYFMPWLENIFIFLQEIFHALAGI